MERIALQPVRLPVQMVEQLGQETGLLLTAVEPNSPAEQGGFVLGDTLVRLDDQRMRQPDDLTAFLVPDRIGQSVTVQLIRGGQIQERPVMIGERT
jgi:S1-C subfamily serine protease